MARVKYTTACVEGWALYCEMLGVEMGVYTTPHEHYGRLEMQMWRAVRPGGGHRHPLVRLEPRAGRGLHGRAPEPVRARTIEGEVDRYAALPAQALGYQIGGLKFGELRQRAQAQLGARFKHRDFHAAVMSAGAVTLPVLDDLLSDWLQRQQTPAVAPCRLTRQRRALRGGQCRARAQPLLIGLPLMASFTKLFGGEMQPVLDGYLNRLTDRYRVLRVDYPSIGGSRDIAPQALTADRVCADLLAVASAAGFDRFAYWGYSWGAAVGPATGRAHRPSERVGGWRLAGRWERPMRASCKPRG
jgi:hypothetical protein